MAIIKGKNPRKPYTVRYRDLAGKQREKSFSTRKEAEAFSHDQDHAKRYETADVNLKARKSLFTDAVDRWLKTGLMVNDRTKDNYLSAFRAWVSDAYKGKTVREAATTPDILRTLVNVTMIDKSGALRSLVRTMIVGTLNMLVNEGTIDGHRVTGIRLAKKRITEAEYDDGGFVFITDDQAEGLAERVGICVWLQLTMGLRISEALGVEKADFIAKGGKRFLRLKWQATRDGRERVALKKRSEGQGRDVPVPDFIWAKVKNLPDGPLMPGKSTRYAPYQSTYDRFKAACKDLGIPEGFTTHSLRHQFASECLDAGMNIVDLSEVLGHSDPSVTLRTYVHAMPNAQDRTRDMMNARWSTPRLKAA